MLNQRLKSIDYKKALLSEGLFHVVAFTVICTLITSCGGAQLKSFFGTSPSVLPPMQESTLQTDDFIDHLAYLSTELIANPDVKIKKISGSHERYLSEIYSRLVLNNELLLDSKIRPRFYLINHPTPLIFSLPKGQFFISNALVKKYIKSEEILVAALTFQIIKSHRNMYEKKAVIPTGTITLERLMGLGRIQLSDKNEIHKWAFLAMRRAGYDENAYLNWLQTLNKGSIDFSLMVGDPSILSREEFAFKSFMVKQKIKETPDRIRDYNSSSEFYQFINYVVRTI